MDSRFLVSGNAIADMIDGLFELFPDGWTMLATLLSVVFLSFLMKKVVWNPVMKLMDDRAKSMTDERNSSIAAKENALSLEEQAKKALEDANMQAQEMILAAKEEAIVKRETLINDSKQEAALIIKNAKNEIKQERAQLARQVKQEIVDVAFDTAEKIVERQIDKKDKDLLDDFVSKLAEKEEQQDESR